MCYALQGSLKQRRQSSKRQQGSLMFKPIVLNQRILSGIDSLAEAYNRRNKMLFKQCLISLELDLAEYAIETEKYHPADSAMIKWYEKMWEFN